MNKKDTVAIVPSTAFYNEIAEEYNTYMTSTDADVRSIVSEKMQVSVRSGTILDFGGGTGLDLEWLHKKYHVIFLEPSEEMRSLAEKNFPDSRISFIKTNSDFNTWSEDNLPFQEKADGALLNFAVVNCIENIDDLFRKLSLVLKPGAIVFATVLNSTITHLFRTNSLKKFLQILTKGRIVYSNHKGISHKAHLHKLSSIKKACSPAFIILTIEVLRDSPFILITFKKADQ